MDLEIIPLARKKIDQREIPNDWIHQTISQPERSIAGHSGRWISQRKFNRSGKVYLLRVIHYLQDEKVIVVTAYLTSQITRYEK